MTTRPYLFCICFMWGLGPASQGKGGLRQSPHGGGTRTQNHRNLLELRRSRIMDSTPMNSRSCTRNCFRAQRAVPDMFPQDVCSWDNFATAAVYVDSNKVPLESGAGALVPVPFRLPKQTRGGGIARVTLEQGFVILRSACDIEAGVVFDS